MPNNKLGSIKLATIISYFSLIVSLISTILFTPFLLNKVGDDYGVFSLAESIVAWLTMISTAISSSYVRFATKESSSNGQDAKKTTTAFAILMSLVSLLSLVIGIVIWLLFKNGIIHNSSLTPSEYNLFNKLLIISIVQCSVEIIYSFFSSFVLYNKKFVPLRLAVLLSAILYPIISSLVLIFSPNMLYVVLILYATRDIFQIVVVIYAFTKLRLKISKVSFTDLRSIFSSIAIFSFFILINTVIDTINSTIDKILLGFIIGSNVVTIYQLGMSFRIYLTSLSLALSNNYVPTINDCAVRGDIDGVNSHFLKVGTFQSILIWLIAGGFAVCGKEFVLLWVGEEKIEVYFIALALIIDESFPLCENISIEYQRATNKHKIRAITYLCCVILNIVVTYCLLKYAKKVNPFLSCLIGTITSDIIGRWIIINIYNQRVLRLKVTRLLASYLIIGGFTILACLISYSFGYIFSYQSNLILFLVKGFVFVISFSMILIIFSIILMSKRPDILESFVPNFLFKIIKKIKFKKSNNRKFMQINNKKRIAVGIIFSLVCYGCSCATGFLNINVSDYKYDDRRYYIFFGETDLENTALTLKADCTMHDKSIITRKAQRMKSANIAIDEVENRLFFVDLPANAYSVSFRIFYQEDMPAWLTTKVYPLESNKCFFLNYTNLDSTYNSRWDKPKLSIESFCYYVLPTIDVNSKSNLDGVNSYDDLCKVFDNLLKKVDYNKIESLFWTDKETGEIRNAKTQLEILKNNSERSEQINVFKVLSILTGSLFPTASVLLFLVWLKYENKE